MFGLKELCRSNRDGSYATQKTRERGFQLIAKQLIYEVGYPTMYVQSLKPKHIEALLAHWVSQDLSISTIKSRMSLLRWWARKIGKPNVIERDNKAYGIGNREYATTISKAVNLDSKKLNEIENELIKMSLKLEHSFGLRREEAIKFMPSYADQGDYIRLKASWCKGGKSRNVPVLTKEQRQVLDDAKLLVGSGSLIPAEMKYFQQRDLYDKVTQKAGFKKLHGLRHLYAQNRYRELTGWECSVKGGEKRRNLKGEMKEKDKKARLIISKELGHERMQIAANYIGP